MPQKISAEWYDPLATSALMKERGIIRDQETIEDVLSRIVTTLVAEDRQLSKNDNRDFADTLTSLTNDGSIVYGTPILTNVGRNGLMTAACTVLPVALRDGQVDVKQFYDTSHQVLGAAIGTGYDLSALKDPATQLLRLNDSINDINRELRQQHKRPVACMATIRADHPDVLQFVAAKKHADFSQWRFNISLFVTEELFQKAEADQDWPLVDDQGQVVEVIKAKTLLLAIAEAAHYCGEPGILFSDRFHNDNPTPEWRYESTAPCAEVAMAEGEVCQFSYVNLSEMFTETRDENGQVQRIVDFAKIGQTAAAITRLLDASVEVTIKNSFFDATRIVGKRRIGVGATGFAGLLLHLRIPYDSPEAEALARQVAEVIDFHAKSESVSLARQRGVFPAILSSRYQNPDWIRRNKKYQTGVITAEAWEQLYQDIEQFGIRNASVTAYPPTGTSSQLASTSTSFEPYYELTHYKKGYPAEPDQSLPVISSAVLQVLRETAQSPAQLVEMIQVIYNRDSDHTLPETYVEEFPYLKTARQIAPLEHLRIQAAFQRFTDEATSKTINLPNHSTVEDVHHALWEAYRLNLKGLTVFRDNCLTERSA